MLCNLEVTAVSPFSSDDYEPKPYRIGAWSEFLKCKAK